MNFKTHHLLLLLLVLGMLAWLHSEWWLAGMGVLVAVAAFDRWAAGGQAETFVDPASGRQLPMIDAGRNGWGGYKLSKFLLEAAEGKPMAIKVTADEARMLAKQAVEAVARNHDPNASEMRALEALEPRCASCGIVFSRALLKQFCVESAGATIVVGVDGNRTFTAQGTCPVCTSSHFILVHAP